MFSLFWKKFSRRFSIYESTHQWLRKAGIPHFAAEENTSTNDKAKEEAFSLSEPLKIYLVDQQTKGRGRGSNIWNNPAVGDALMLSFSFQMNRAPQPISTPLAGLAVARALQKSFHLKTLSMKAPNDILLNGKKIAGLLIEAVQMGDRNRLIIGLGLNVFSCPENLKQEASYLNEETRISKRTWTAFLECLLTEIRLASQEALGSHLSNNQRNEILNFLNQNPSITEKYDSLSPFGDLSSNEQVVSWRDL